MDLSKAERERYSRHLLLPELGLAGQLKLKQAKVLIVGAGGLGAPALLYLAAAGVGNIGVLDFDKVDRSNLQRQIIYIDADVGAAKTEQAAERASRLNPEIHIEKHELRLNADNALETLRPYDIIIDGSDNFPTRYLVNDVCVLLKKPNVYGAIYRFEGQATVFSWGDGPCYRCLFPEPPGAEALPNCAEAGVLGVMAGSIGCIQATEALKIILGIGASLSGRLLLYDALNMRFSTMPLPKSPDCPVCGKAPRILTLTESAPGCAPASMPAPEKSISPLELQSEIESGKKILVLDVRTAAELASGKIPNSTHIPLAELSARVAELPPDHEIVVYCKSGFRSAKAQATLAEHGFSKVRNLTGGISAWISFLEEAPTIKQ